MAILGIFAKRFFSFNILIISVKERMLSYFLFDLLANLEYKFFKYFWYLSITLKYDFSYLSSSWSKSIKSSEFFKYIFLTLSNSKSISVAAKSGNFEYPIERCRWINYFVFIFETFPNFSFFCSSSFNFNFDWSTFHFYFIF